MTRPHTRPSAPCSPMKRQPQQSAPPIGAAAALTLLALLSACSGPSLGTRSDGLAVLTRPWVRTGGPGWQEMLAGDSVKARQVFTDLEERGGSTSDLLWARFGRGEAAYLDGHYAESLEAHVGVVEAGSQTDLAIWSLLRIMDLDGLAADYEAVAARVAEVKPPEDSADFRYLQNQIMMEVARRRWLRSDATAPFDGAPYGVPTAWRVVGPTSVNANLDFDDETVPEHDDSLADTYELLGYLRRTRLESTNSMLVKPIVSLSGVYVAETWLTVPRQTTVDIAGQFQGLAWVTLDGVPVLHRDDRDEYGPTRVRTRGVELSAGVHRVVARLGISRDYKEGFGLMFLPHGAQTLHFSATPPSGASGEIEETGTIVPWVTSPGDLAEWDNPVALALAAQMAVDFEDEGVARQVLEALDERAPGFGGRHLLRAEMNSSLWSVPSTISDREIIASLREATKADPGLYRAKLWLAALLRGQGRKDVAKEAVNELTEARPTEVSTWTEAARYYQWRGFGPQAEDALRRAQELDPAHCTIAESLYAQLRARNQVLDVGSLPRQTQRCDLLRWHVADDVKAMTGSPEDVLMLVSRDVQRYPDRTWTYKAQAEALSEYVGPEAAIEVLEQGLGRIPGDPTLAVFKADLESSLDNEAKAAETLSAALEENPGLRSLHDRLALLRGTLPLDDLDTSGLAAIAEYEKAPASFPSAAIYVLDYMARRYFEDGSSADVTHLVIKVLAKEGIDEFAEVHFPRGAVKLLARTVKSDGQVIEPKPTSGKPTISMPSLDVGDYIEYAYLTFNSRLATGKGAVVGADFYFKMANLASAHSEYLIEVPAAWRPKIVSRNDAPKAVISTHDGLVRYQFLRTGSAQPRPEPLSVSNAEYLPHIQMVNRFSWEDAYHSLQNRLAGARAQSPLLRKRATEVTADAESRLAKTRALFAFVKTHVRQRSYGNFTTPATHVEQSGEGNPLVLLQALLSAVGIDSELYRIKPDTADPVETAIPAINAYAFTALRVEIDGQALWLNPAGPNAIFDYLPRSVQGVPAICLEPGRGIDRVTTPTYDEKLERRDVDFTLHLDGQGNLTGKAVETLRGGRAIARRNAYDDLASDDKIRKYIERTVNYDFSGGQLLSYEIEGRDDPEGDLVLTYRFQRPGYARKDTVGLVIEDRYDLPDLTRRFAPLAVRTVPMLLGRRLDESIHVQFNFPTHTRVSGPGGDDEVAYSTAFGSYERNVTAVGDQLDIHHRLVMPVQRITPEAYPEFVEWAGDIDRATYGRIVVK